MGIKRFFTLILISSIFFSSMIGCSKSNSDGNRSLAVDPVGTDPDGGDGDNGNGSDGSDPIISNGLFSNSLGSTIPVSKALQFDPDYTGETVVSDYDGDGIPNEKEVNNFSNQFVVDYPKIVAHIAPPITMQIRIDQSDETKNHSETLTDENFKSTMSNSMESRQYAQVNLKTTPVVTKESASNRQNDAGSWGHTESESSGSNSSFGAPQTFSIGSGSNSSSSVTDNESWDKGFEKSHMSEKTEFRNVDYMDNLSRNGMEYTEETVQNMTKNYRQSNILNSDITISENAGFVRGALFLKNESIDIPAKISNVKCTLSFRTPNGTCLPVKTFLLREDDWSDFNQEIGGGEELGPYTVEITDLNTREVREALRNGYVPQIHVVSYDITRVKDSIYNPGVDNLKMVEEAAKGRTALIKISGSDFRESYRVCAFDVEPNGDLTPGVSLKKALFNIYRNQLAGGEKWSTDENNKPLTVTDSNLRWKEGAPSKINHTFTNLNSDDNYFTGNNWDKFETYIKKWTDEKKQVHYIETIRRIDTLRAWNSFDKEDNPSYNPSERITDNELNKTKYWIILHNGKYFEGDINDPIWAGDRYEIIFFDVDDFNSRLHTFYYTPLQSKEALYFDTRWNSLSDKEEFSRAINLGKIYKGDVVKLEIDLLSNRYLFDTKVPIIEKDSDNDKTTWKGSDFNYNLISVEDEENIPDGMPGNFTHEAFGGTNNISVRISESQYAKSYQVILKNKTTSAEKIVNIPAKILNDNYGSLTICNKTRVNWNSGDEIGVIAGGDYSVLVKATGILYGVTIPKNSSTNEPFAKGVLKVTVDDLPNDSQQPYNAYFTASGYENEIDVNISDDIGNYTEYFIIRCSGPLNYDNSTTVDVIGKSGSNIIKIATPTNAVEDGLFTINVFPVNQNNLETYASHSGSQGSEEYVKVEYDKYANQKLMRPKKSDDFHQFEALDFEVNFNDGSGWYKLRFLSHDDEKGSIDCRYTSYMDYDKQKFYVSFRPPAGLDEEYYQSTNDVFKGGKEYADLYIRTVPSEKYRDRFWPKNGSIADILSYNPVENGILNFWVNVPAIVSEDKIGTWYSDATLIDSILNGTLEDTLPYSVSSSNISDYFFAPKEQKTYMVRASVETELQFGDKDTIDPPLIGDIEPGNKELVFSDISSKYAYQYCFFWKEAQEGVTDLTQVLEQNVLLWNSVMDVDIVDLKDKATNTLKFTLKNNLIPNQGYVLAVAGRNKYGALSQATFFKDKSTGKAKIVYPYSTDKPAAPENISLNLGSVGNEIVIANISSPGQKRFQVQWRRASDPTNWSVGTTKEVSTDNFDPFSCTLTSADGIMFWESYIFRVRAILDNSEVSGELILGSWSSEKTISTGTSIAFGTISADYYNMDILGNKYYIDYFVKTTEFPVNTSSVKVTGTFEYTTTVIVKQLKMRGSSDYYVETTSSISTPKSITINKTVSSVNSNSGATLPVISNLLYYDSIIDGQYAGMFYGTFTSTGTVKLTYTFTCYNKNGESITSNTYTKTFSDLSKSSW